MKPKSKKSSHLVLLLEVLGNRIPRRMPVRHDRKERTHPFELILPMINYNRLIILNATGRFIYSLIDGKRSIKDIHSIMKKHYPKIPDTVLIRDIISFMRDTEYKRLVSTRLYC
ncbi:MAG: PqqD family protein [Candidatus Helarchaeota archaeon]